MVGITRVALCRHALNEHALVESLDPLSWMEYPVLIGRIRVDLRHRIGWAVPRSVPNIRSGPVPADACTGCTVVDESVGAPPALVNELVPLPVKERDRWREAVPIGRIG